MSFATHEGNIQSGNTYAHVALPVVAGLAAATVLSEFVMPTVQRFRGGSTRFVGEGPIFIFGGLKCANGDFLVEPVQQLLGEAATSVHYAQGGLRTEEIGDRLSKRLASMPETDWKLVGHSLGLEAALYSLIWAVENDLPVKPLREVWALSSPLDPSDIINAEKYAVLPSALSYVGGALCRAVGTVLTETWNLPSPLKHVPQAVHDFFVHGAEIQNTRQWASHLAIGLQKAEPNFSVLHAAGVIGEHTTVYGVYHEGDKVVKAPQAAERLVRVLSAVGVRCYIVMDESATHADPTVLDRTKLDARLQPSFVPVAA